MPISARVKFTRSSHVLVQIEAYLKEVKDEVHTIYTFELHGEELRILWDKVKLAYEQCLDSPTTSKFLKDDAEVDTEVVMGKYRTTYIAFITCLGKINEKKYKLEADRKSVNLPAANQASCDISGHNLTLPPCFFDMFEGDYLSWPTFRDLFTALYVNSSRLSNIERLCHLLRKTSGEAKEIVSKCPLSHEGFDKAWKNLTEAYENPRMLVNNPTRNE